MITINFQVFLLLQRTPKWVFLHTSLITNLRERREWWPWVFHLETLNQLWRQQSKLNLENDEWFKGMQEDPKPQGVYRQVGEGGTTSPNNMLNVVGEGNTSCGRTEIENVSPWGTGKSSWRRYWSSKVLKSESAWTRRKKKQAFQMKEKKFMSSGRRKELSMERMYGTTRQKLGNFSVIYSVKLNK